MSLEKTLWAVWRQDDNSNTFLVEKGLSEEGAKKLVEKYEAKGHKQTYWSEEYKAGGEP